MSLAPEEREHLLNLAGMVRDEAAFVRRRARLLVQLAARLESEVAEIVESEEGHNDNGERPS